MTVWSMLRLLWLVRWNLANSYLLFENSANGLYPTEMKQACTCIPDTEGFSVDTIIDTPCKVLTMHSLALAMRMSHHPNALES